MSALLVAKNIKKYYGSFAAVENVSLTVEKGTIHAIIGENGAGKSTLMNILAGVHEPTDGEIILNGQVKRFKNATDAARSGIGMVQQEFMLFPELTVLENIILGHEPLKGRAFLNMGESEKRIRAICGDYGFRFDLHAPRRACPLYSNSRWRSSRCCLPTPISLSWTNPPQCCRPRRWRDCLRPSASW